jgi:GTP cyclohydrolase I
MSANELADVQRSESAHLVPIDAVGISNLRHPVVVLDRTQAKQETVATISMSVDLDAHSRGAHLSRFLELLDEAAGELTARTAPHLLASLRQRLGSTSASVVVEFPYFIEKRAPVTGARGLLDIACQFSFRATASESDFVLKATVPVTTLCPCSRAVSDYGAHNQRCDVTIAVRVNGHGEGMADDDILWIEELVQLAESNASAPIYPTLKRADERFVTMQAYDNPAFVEDVARGVAAALMADTRVAAFSVEASSDESIHNHRAFARIGTPLR